MFSRVLVANRGEIACRVMATCRRLGISTVAVYSDADAGARHVALADAAVGIGGAAAAESYLRGERIVEAALATGAEAVHPGYGFLSENPAFVELVEAAGLVFIGPSAAAIRAMGLKDAAKALMEAAGVPVVPGYHGAEQGEARLAAEAAAIGFPVLIKAVAGGGGKGMRRVERAEDFARALAAARGEARAAFGNDAVLVEKYVSAPRHVEIQVFGDGREAVHLFERDCSLQRRHQKVIEEAPAPGMTPEVRAAMGRAAVAAAEAIGYAGAGTVEFIADGSRGLRADGFWFMEMNTRLQVEHPVTEAVTGEDLVEWQLRVAAGERLPKRQEELTLSGHAVEARLYAEDPAKGFLPAIGRLTHLSFPEGVRVDAGVRAGDEVSPWYDPMIAKVIAHGETREIALRRLGRALEATRVAGCRTNLGFLARLVRQADFAAGRVDTGLIERDLTALTEPRPVSFAVLAAAALAAGGQIGEGDPLAGFALWAPLVRSAPVEVGGERRTLRVETLGPGRFRVDGRAVAVTGGADGELVLTVEGGAERLGLAVDGGSVTVFEGAEATVVTIPDPLAAGAEAAAHGDDVRAPMPGLVRELAAAVGQRVARGEPLVVLEAMKMEHALLAPRDGVIAEVLVAAGVQVTEGTLLLLLEPGDG
ncbi:biotin carboxylase N-terminal domain-containing protein [Amaricoccus sp.]|uniref:ATP-binding protein n=1 Tax=Amaricoccus sp. TaxID=1872485 RepID=UPI0026357207|nr:biotin carboxylase N-terminal domain-containing protein [Amaricoccus sp.]HRO11466.1 biotin carboxylase N-terminal domain-containing protein [Amaricoccus sp.]